MYQDMHQWTEIRRLVLTKQKSKRAICQEFHLHWKTLEKILNHVEPPGYRQRQARAKPKLDRFRLRVLPAAATVPRGGGGTFDRRPQTPGLILD